MQASATETSIACAYLIRKHGKPFMYGSNLLHTNFKDRVMSPPLSEKERKEIYELRMSGVQFTEIAKKFNRGCTTIHRAFNRYKP